MSLVIVGSVAFDAIETPRGKTDKIIGGAGTYICFASSYFSKNLKVISVVGNDFPQEYIDKLVNKGINTDGLQVKKDQKTFFWSGRYHENMNSRETLVTELNVLENFDPIVPDSSQNSDFLMLGNLSPVVQRTVIERLKKRPKLIVMDTMNFWMEIMHAELMKTISMTDVLSLNDEEARQLSGEFNLLDAASKILKMGPKYLIIKKGEHGAFLFNNEEIFYAPAMPLSVVEDPTGAGDTFAGGFIGYLARTGDISFDNMKRAIIAGTALASFCVQKFGTQGIENLSEKEIFSQMKKLSELTKVDITRF